MLDRYCEPLVVGKCSWRLIGAVFDFRKEQHKRTVRMYMNLSPHNGSGCYQFDRSGQGKVMMIGIRLGGACIGVLHGP
jgi:hypothetical protein